MKPVLLSIVLVFAHIAPPLLCRGGLLSHVCHETCCPEQETCCPSDEGCAPAEKADCGHEPDCASDPCDEMSAAALVASRPNQAVELLAPVTLLPPEPLIASPAGFARITGDAIILASSVCAEFRTPLLI